MIVRPIVFASSAVLKTPPVVLSRFRTYRAVEVALYHSLGRLPEPDFTHRFC